VELFDSARARAYGAKEAKRRAGKCPTNSLTLPLGVSFDRITEKWSWNLTARAQSVVQIFHSYVNETHNLSALAKRFGLTPATIRNVLSRPIYATGEREFTQKRGEKRVSRNGKLYRVKIARAPGPRHLRSLQRSPPCPKERSGALTVAMSCRCQSSTRAKINAESGIAIKAQDAYRRRRGERDYDKHAARLHSTTDHQR
jgi:hypothetical protein